MNNKAYGCRNLECARVYVTTFISEGLRCPYCNSDVYQMDIDIFTRKEFNQLSNKFKDNKTLEDMI